MTARQRVGRLMQSEEMAAAVPYLASKDASLMTGSALTMDGGLTARLARPGEADRRPASSPDGDGR